VEEGFWEAALAEPRELRNSKVEHQQSYRNREDPIAERLNPSLGHESVNAKTVWRQHRVSRAAR
jgi:hypothetical protein